MTTQWADRLHIFALDVGTPRVNPTGRGFAWARSPAIDGALREWSGLASMTATSTIVMTNLVDAIVTSLSAGRSVALGFECPTYIPVHDAVEFLGGARSIDGNRAWSAGAGTGAMATGMAQAAWILSQLAVRVAPSDRVAAVAWAPFREGRARLFLWEAFVSGAAKTSGLTASTHAGDADLAVAAFRDGLAASDAPPGVFHDAPGTRVFNWLAAVAGWAGMTFAPDAVEVDPTTMPGLCVGPQWPPLRGAGVR